MTLAIELVGGFLGLLVGGELLVRGASGVARRLGLSALVVGVVIVGFGTSTPELVTSVEAALAGAPGIAVGNIVGSNIANILLILGLAAALCPFVTSAKSVIRDGSIVIATAVAFALAAWTGTIERWVGALFVVALVAYMAFALRSDGGQAVSEDAPGEGATPLRLSVVFVLVGLVVIVVGAHFLVESAVELARIFLVPEEVIGLTMVAVGTSLPELATTIVAAMRRHSQIALGNVLGSNVYNTIGIGGITALVAPIPVSATMMTIDIPLMLAISVLLMVVVATGMRVTRWEGLALLGLYVVYMAYQASFAGTATPA